MRKGPLTCEEAERLIPLYVACLLDDPSLFEEHLKECEECRKKVTAERFIEETLKNLEGYPPPPGLKEDILKMARPRSGRISPLKRPLFWTFVGSALLILILLSIFLWKPKTYNLEAAPLTGEVLFPSQDAVVLAKDFKLVFVYAPERPDIDVSVYIDDGEVTATSLSLEGLIIYETEEVEEGYHEIWVKLRDPKTGQEKEFQRTIYVIGGKK